MLSTSERTLLAHLSILSSSTIADPLWAAALAALKAALYCREENALRGDDDLARRVYVARWVPSHALVLRKIFVEVGVREMLREGGEVVALGGGSGSEVLALSSLLSTSSSSTVPVRISTYDIVDWTNARPAAVLPPHLTHTALTADVISLPLPTFPSPTLITLLFTTAELFAQSRPKTVALLAHLASISDVGTQLLVVESAALTEVPVGKTTYPLETLVDHALGKSWEVVKEDKDRWFRLPAEEVTEAYPIKLENMKVLLRLYEKV